MQGCGQQQEQGEDVRARINAKMGAAARQGASTREAVQVRVKALAEAVRAAQETEIRAYAKAGFRPVPHLEGRTQDTLIMQHHPEATPT